MWREAATASSLVSSGQRRSLSSFSTASARVLATPAKKSTGGELMISYKPYCFGSRKRLYFAGKIKKNDWRHDLAPNLRGLIYPSDDDSTLFDPEFTLDCDNFIYGGPFFVSCDHGCFHGPANHGVGIVLNEGGDDPVHGRFIAERRAAIFNINAARLKHADRVFAYLEDVDCYGTLVELGMAAAWGKPIAIGVARSVDLERCDDLWMAMQTAGRRLYLGSAMECWAQYCRDSWLGD